MAANANKSKKSKYNKDNYEGEHIPYVRGTKKYDPKIHPQMVIDYMSQGASKVELAARMGVDRRTITNWQKDPNKPEFMEAIRRGEDLCQAWWETAGRRMVTGEAKGNIVGWIYNMKCRFHEDWSEVQKQELKVTSEVEQLSNDDLNKLLKEGMENLKLEQDKGKK